MEVVRRLPQKFPFSAIVGQETLKLSLLLNAVDPRVGGVLIRGEKGTAKSTAVRALLAVLPQMDVVEGCQYGCDPGDPAQWCDDCRDRRDEGPLPKIRAVPRMVDLPVSATEDRLVGTLDFQAAIREGERSFHPGLLAAANRGILYVDEVNLLDDHLVDTLLDAAAMGVNVVEREGVSLAHPARFILVGTMNPEEGDIRPQLLDRFGLCVGVEAMREPEARVEIVLRRHAFEEDPSAFARQWADAEDELKNRIRDARLRLPGVRLGEGILYAIADLSIRAAVDGHRADSVMARAAAALAALENRPEATLSDVERVAPLVLAHRLRRTPFSEVRSDTDTLRTALMDALSSGAGRSQEQEGSTAAGPGLGQASIFESLGSASSSSEDPADVCINVESDLDRTRRSIAGRRQTSVSDDGRGRYSRSEVPKGDVTMADVAFDATIRAAASRASDSKTLGDMALSVQPEDLRTKVRTRKVGASIVFCVDASGSMGSDKRIDAAKAAVLDLLVDAYQKRDRVALVSFRGNKAEVVLAPTASVELANVRLRNLPTGGATPLAAGIVSSLDILQSELRRQPDTVAWLVLVTDGRGNVGLDGGSGSEDARIAATRVRMANVHTIVIDTASGPTGGTAAREIARMAGGEYVRLSALDGAELGRVVRSRI
ncbi:MAG: magnesium chelatase [Actinobacteria bacterium HGW-Actinobacteria-7]|nr:MAG: magnesium chelatase [Actinobacteria bacterium HGW-Actinobacteria-7]